MDWINFVIFPLVGGVIGAVTNQVAIRMLFRPYESWHLGPWRVPLTPGVIPLQRKTIAKNIARTFESNLLSGDDLHAIITGAKTRVAVEAKVDELFDDFGAMGRMLKSLKPRIVEKILAGIEELATNAIAQGGDLDVGQKIEERINAMDIEQLEDLILGFSRKQFQHITLFGGLIGALIGIVQAALDALLGMA